ncbi:MAG: hypothetical protein J6W30_05325 [Bacteroidales bacterium]|nr:hypothetical protein [Bacteroidales bacterium]
MMENATLNYNEPLLDEILTAQIHDVFASETQKPAKSVLDFIFGYAAAYESVENGLFGRVEFSKN